MEYKIFGDELHIIYLQYECLVLTICRLDQREGSSVAVLEIKGSKGSVHVNGKTIKKGTSCVLSSGDEVVFGSHGNHAYVSFL